MKIVSILASVEMQNPLDLDLLLNKLENAKKNSYINLVYTRLKPGNHYVSFYGSGKFLIYGLKTFEEMDNVIDNILNEFKKAGIENNIKKTKISNIVLTNHLKLDKNLDLWKILLSTDSSKASYEPEQFPGLTYKDSNNISFIIFSNGKMIITGVKDLDLAKKQLEEFKRLIYNS